MLISWNLIREIINILFLIKIFILQFVFYFETFKRQEILDFKIYIKATLGAGEGI